MGEKLRVKQTLGRGILLGIGIILGMIIIVVGGIFVLVLFTPSGGWNGVNVTAVNVYGYQVNNNATYTTGSSKGLVSNENSVIIDTVTLTASPYNETINSFKISTPGFELINVSPELPTKITANRNETFTLNIRTPDFKYIGPLSITDSYISQIPKYTYSPTNVVLTGGCTEPKPLSNNTFNFSIRNSGNGTALNLSLTPKVESAQVVGRYFTNSLAPGNLKTFLVQLSNVTAKGTYTAYVIATYLQDNFSYATGILPCTISFVNATKPQLLLLLNETRLASSLRVNVSAYNSAPYSITANLSLVLPPSITPISKIQSQVTVAPYQMTTVSFFLTPPALNTSYSITGVAVADYERDGFHYSFSTPFPISNMFSH